MQNSQKIGIILKNPKEHIFLNKKPIYHGLMYIISQISQKMSWIRFLSEKSGISHDFDTNPYNEIINIFQKIDLSKF